MTEPSHRAGPRPEVMAALREMWTTTWSQPVEAGLSEEQRRLLHHGCEQFTDNGPGRLSDRLAALLDLPAGTSGIETVADLADRIERDQVLTVNEWAQALAATELAFIGDLFGVSSEWYNVTGLEDVETLTLLRSTQYQLEQVGVRFPLPLSLETLGSLRWS